MPFVGVGRVGRSVGSVIASVGSLGRSGRPVVSVGRSVGRSCRVGRVASCRVVSVVSCRVVSCRVVECPHFGTGPGSGMRVASKSKSLSNLR